VELRFLNDRLASVAAHIPNPDEVLAQQPGERQDDGSVLLSRGIRVSAPKRITGESVIDWADLCLFEEARTWIMAYA
jgi:hypothetical protein